jgi:hypothetical protein
VLLCSCACYAVAGEYACCGLYRSSSSITYLFSIRHHVSVITLVGVASLDCYRYVCAKLQRLTGLRSNCLQLSGSKGVPKRTET